MYNSLPIEIWRQIFATAVRPCVHAQRLHTTGDNDDDDDDDPFNSHSSHLLHDTIRTKLALCLVSKLFNNLATEFLYESVHVTDINNYSLDTGSTNKFWWTKVLHLRFSSGMGGLVPLLTHLLSKCVNLRLLRFEAAMVHRDLSPDQVKSVCRSFPRGVQAIGWGWDTQRMLENIPITVLENICHISVAHVGSTTIKSTHVLTLPRVTYLRAIDSFTPTNLIFPALKTVCLVVHYHIYGLETCPLALFIQSEAKQITTLHIDSDPLSATVVMPLLLIDRCTNLTTLKYDPFMVQVEYPPLVNTTQHTKLTHVYNLISHRFRSTFDNIPSSLPLLRRFWTANCNWLFNGGFPALKHITMLRSCVLDPIEEQVLSQIVSASTDPRLKIECGVSACT